MKTAQRERFCADKGGEGEVGGVDNLQTDFHAYYTNDFMIFDVAAGVGRMWRGWAGFFLSLISMARLNDGVI